MPAAKLMRRMARIRAELLEHYRDGKSAAWSATLVRCDHRIAQRFFAEFEFAGIERPPVRNKPCPPRSRMVDYDGPELIGFSADVLPS